MKNALRIAAQLLLYVPLMALIGYFSTQPRFSILGEDEALVRLSIVHATQLKHPCRQRSAAELAKLAPNMRAMLECKRERSPLLVELELDGKVVLRREVEPSGLRRDGNAVLYERMALPAGRHRVVARLGDRHHDDDDDDHDHDADEGRDKKKFDYVAERTLELPDGGVLVIDFNAAQGGFVFRL